MKKILFIAMSMVSLHCTSQTTSRVKTVPDEVITNDSTAWTISTLSSVGYINNTPGPYYNSYKSGGGMLGKFNFKKNGRFSFMLYVQANTYGTDTETWTQVEGTVEFKKDAKGQDIFVTKAEKGTYRVTKNGITSSRPIPKNELLGQHSQTFLWQKTSFRDDPNNIYLLMVDLEEHPEADINKAGTIQPEWVSKFHIPARK